MTKREREVDGGDQLHELVRDLASEIADEINDVGGGRVVVESEIAVRSSDVEDREGWT
jgi:hypothetical protein